jgi:hypothetical protein
MEPVFTILRSCVGSSLSLGLGLGLGLGYCPPPPDSDPPPPPPDGEKVAQPLISTNPRINSIRIETLSGLFIFASLITAFISATPSKAVW